MSHFTKLAKANITSAAAFAAAAQELGLRVSLNAEGKCFSGRNKIMADVVVHVLDGDDIVLTKNDQGTFDMQADWSYRGRALAEACKFKSASELQDRLIQLTTKNTIVDRYRKQGFRAEVTEDENQNMNVTLTRY